MAKWQGRSLKKASGGRKWHSRKKRKYELGRESANTKIGEEKKVEISVRGNENKIRLLSTNSVNITDPETGDSEKAEIKSVLKNPADPHLARRNIITKGAVIDTSIGKARVTSRPGQEQVLDAVLLERSSEGDLKSEESEESSQDSEEAQSEEE